MDRGELQEAVARLIVDGTYDATADVVAGAAIRVVLAEARRSVEALRLGDGPRDYDEGPGYERALDDVLAVLVPPPPV